MEYVIEEKPFQFDFNGQIVDAYVRVYNTGDSDVELIENHPDFIWDIAFDIAVERGLI